MILFPQQWKQKPTGKRLLYILARKKYNFIQERISLIKCWKQTKNICSVTGAIFFLCVQLFRSQYGEENKQKPKNSVLRLTKNKK